MLIRNNLGKLIPPEWKQVDDEFYKKLKIFFTRRKKCLFAINLTSIISRSISAGLVKCI